MIHESLNALTYVHVGSEPAAIFVFIHVHAMTLTNPLVDVAFPKPSLAGATASAKPCNPKAPYPKSFIPKPLAGPTERIWISMAREGANKSTADEPKSRVCVVSRPSLFFLIV